MSSSLTIYFATVTGNAETLAQRAAESARNAGWTVSQKNLCDVKVGELSAQSLALFIVSTWGDGEPPDDACAFWQALAASPTHLPNLRYAVFGLGDRDYSEFNAFARNLDERLSTLGAQRLHERIEADAQFDDTYVAWEASILPALAGQRVFATS